MDKLRQIQRRFRLAATGAKRVLGRLKYAVLADGVAFLFAVFVFFLINHGFYGSLLLSRLPLLDKIGVLGGMIGQMFVGFFTTVNGFLLLVVAVLQGVSIALLAYVLKKNKQSSGLMPAKQIGASGFAAIAAALGLGCVPCGTSLLLPVAAVFFSGSAAAAAVNSASLVILLIALVVSLFAISKTGYIAYIYTEEEKGGDNV